MFFAGLVVLASAAMGLYNLRLRTHLFGLALRFLIMAGLALTAILRRAQGVSGVSPVSR